MSGSRDATRGGPEGRVRIGTSGWHYESWLGPFYPPKLPKARLLASYAERFESAEVNVSFYRLPSPEALASWREATPEGFVFAWKAHRVITHYRRLRNVTENIALVFDRMAALGDREGPVLFQLPPAFRADRERLAAFLGELPPRRRYAFEFRHPSWYEAPILEVLRDHDVALCFSDHVHAPAPWDLTASFVYWRGHGSSGRYHGSYGDPALSDLAGRVRTWRGEGRDVFCYFDNDVKAAAPADAARLRALLA